VLAKLPPHVGEGLLVDESTGDDAAVLRIDGERALVQTVDFFTPIVDDPYVFGAIAAANSVSDIYAMGAEPILGLAIAGFPTKELPLSILEEILRGGAEKAAEAGFPVAGGHTIIDDVPKYGLAVTGIAPLDRIVRNSTARSGDVLYLTKPIGTGILVAAFRATAHKEDAPAVPSLDEAIRWMTTLNRDAARAMLEAGASAATDVTGYGLLGHLLEICRGSGVGARVSAGAIPLIEGAREWLERGFVSGGTKRNLAAYGSSLRSSLPESETLILADAQTSGGLLIAIAPEREEALRRALDARGVPVWRIGELTAEREIIEIAP
jgi:selenide,water dikinase